VRSRRGQCESQAGLPTTSAAGQVAIASGREEQWGSALQTVVSLSVRGRSLPDGDKAEAELHEVKRSGGSHLGQGFASCETNSNSLSERRWAAHQASMVFIAPDTRKVGSWMEDALETRTITAPNRCHRSRLDHRVCGRPTRNGVLVQRSPDQSRTVDPHPTMTVNLSCPYVDQHRTGSAQLATCRGRARRSGGANPWAHRAVPLLVREDTPL